MASSHKKKNRQLISSCALPLLIHTATGEASVKERTSSPIQVIVAQLFTHWGMLHDPTNHLRSRVLAEVGDHFSAKSLRDIYGIICWPYEIINLKTGLL